MRTARLHRPFDVRLHDEPDPGPDADEALVRVLAVGLCGSDRHWFVEGGIGDAVLTRPLVLGHEVSGVIEGGARRGERVALDASVPCGRCELCRADLAHLCHDTKFAGHSTTDGGLRTLMPWPQRHLVPIPDDMTDVEAALLEPLAVALHAADLGRSAAGMSAGVFGCGPIGLLLIAVLRARGVSPIVATDQLPDRRAAAMAFGASEVSEPRSNGAPGASLVGSWAPVDVAFEAAGADGAVDDAIACVRTAGRVVLAGIPVGDRTSFRASVARRKALTLLLSRRSTSADLHNALLLANSRQVDLTAMPVTRYSLAHVGSAFDDLGRREAVKVVVQPQA